VSKRLLVDIAEDCGLDTEEEIRRRLPHLQTREINELYELLDLALEANRNEAGKLEPSSFNFFVSSAMRGDRFCIHAECRLRKIPLIERYAALYGDHLLLPVRMVDQSKRTRILSIETLLRTICSLRPMVDSGLIIPVATGICVCRHCQPLLQEDISSVSKIGNHIASRYFDEFSVEYSWDRSQRLHIMAIRGPKEFLDEGFAIRSYRTLPSWFSGEDKKARALTKSELVDSQLIEGVFNASAYDIVTQASHAEDNGCSYLSDSEAEAAFFDDPELPTDGALSRSEVAASLMHDVPMFSEISTNGLLQLRRDYPDAFRAYRSALSAATLQQGELMSSGRLRVQEFYRDVIEPRVEQLRSLDSSSRVASLKSVGLSVAIPSISLLFGLLDQGLPNTLAEAARILGAAGLAKAIVDPVKDATSRSTAVKADPYFFLLKMDKTWRKERESCR
jgi:hypothetical protein